MCLNGLAKLNTRQHAYGLEAATLHSGADTQKQSTLPYVAKYLKNWKLAAAATAVAAAATAVAAAAAAAQLLFLFAGSCKKAMPCNTVTCFKQQHHQSLICLQCAAMYGRGLQYCS